MELEIYILPGPDGKVRVSGPGHLHTASSYDLIVVSDSFRALSPGDTATATVSYLGHDVTSTLSRSDVFGNRMTGHLDMPEPQASDFTAAAPAAKPEFTVDSAFRVVVDSDGSTVASGIVPVVVCMGMSDPSYEVDPPSGGTVLPGSTPGVDLEIVEGSMKPVAGGTLYTRFKAVEAAIASASAVTKAALGLGNVDNTSDADKPVSTAVAAEITAVRSELAQLKQAVENLTGTEIEIETPEGGTTEGEEINATWLYNAVDRLDKDLDTLAQRVTKVEEDQAGVVEQSNWVAERSAGLETSLRDLMDKWRDAKSEMIELEGSVIGYSQTVTSSMATIVSNRDRVASVEARVDALEGAVVAGPLDTTGLTARVKVVEDRVKLAETFASDAIEKAEAAKDTADGFADTISGLEQRLAEYSTGEADFRNDMKTAVDSAVTAADSAAAAVSAVSENLESVVTAKVGETVEAKVGEAVEAVETRVGEAVEAKIGEAVEAVEAKIGEAVEAAETRVGEAAEAKIGEAVEAVDVNLAALSERIDDLVPKVAAAGVTRVVIPDQKRASGTVNSVVFHSMPVGVLVNNAVNYSKGSSEVFMLPPPSDDGGMDLYIVETVPANKGYASFHVEPRVCEDLVSSAPFVRRGKIYAGSGITSIAASSVSVVDGVAISDPGYPFKRFVIDAVAASTVCVFRLTRVPDPSDSYDSPVWTFVASLAARCKMSDNYSSTTAITRVN